MPVIYLSSYTDKETFELAKTTEPYGYILKPFDEKKLEVAIELALYRYEMSQKLAESEERYVMTTSAGKIGVWDWNLETDEIYIDPCLKAILGYLDHEIRNHMDDWSRHVYSEDRDMVSAKASAYFEGKTHQFEVEHRMIHKNGSLRWFLARGKVMRNEKGKPYRMIGTDIDITERKEVEIALKKTLDFEKSLANCSQLLLESKNPDEAIKAISAEFISLMSVNLIHVFEINKENSGKTFAKLISEELADGLKAHKDNPSLQHLSFDDNSSAILDKLAKGETCTGIVSKLPAAEREVLSSIGIVSILVVPIRIGEELWGTFILGDCGKSRVWKNEELRFAKIISSMIANLIERNRAREETQRYMAELEEISEFSTVLSRCTDVDEILELVGSKTYELSGGAYVIVTLADADSDNIRIRKQYGLGKYVDAVLKTLQNDPREMVFSVNDMTDDEKALFTSGKLSLMPGGLYNLTARRFPENVCKTLERILRIEKIYTMGFTFGKKPFGGVNILMEKGAKLSHRFTLETTIRQASFAIHRKRAEDERLKTAIELKDTSALLETVFDVIPDIIGVQDMERRIIRYNRAGYDFLNQTPEGVAGKKCFELISQDQPCEICATEIVYKTKKPAHVEKYFEELGVWLDCRSYPVLDDNGKIISIVEHLRDITERKKTEDSLRKERKAFGIIAESTLQYQSIPDLCRQILQGLLETLDFDFGTIRLYDKETRSLEPTAVIGFDEKTIAEKVKPQSIDDSGLIGASVARSRQAIFAPDTGKHKISSSHR
ncbi:PAS domain-containing protein, partial [candidate division WOR-3 bacterium]|nr:PAS domain-containing protein [candidate division WOR-3 bacterium]